MENHIAQSVKLECMGGNAPVEALIESINKAGFRVNNLFEMEGGWQANITDGELFFEFGRGATMQEALSNALHKRGEGKRAKRREAVVSTVAVDDLIAKGL